MSDKTREGMSGGGPVFGVPLHQCVDASSWRRRPGVVPTGLESASQPQTHLDEANTQHKADLLGRISSGSIFDSRSMERVSHALWKSPKNNSLSTNLYASLWFWTKDAAEPRRFNWPLQCWFPMILQPKEVVFHDLLFLLLPYPSKNGRKCEGHPCMQKGINLSVSTN